MVMVMIAYEQLLNEDFGWALREGGMHLEGQGGVHTTLRRLAERLDGLGVDYAIAGGMALFFHGHRRFTEDVDVLVTPDGLETIHAELDGRGYARPFEKSRNLRDTATGVRIDFLVSGQYPGDGRPGVIAFPVPSGVTTVAQGIRFLYLPTLVELKLASGRASHRAGDLADVQRLIQARDLSRDFAGQLDPAVRDAFLAKWDDAQRAIRDDR